MIQDIAPSKLHNEYHPWSPSLQDTVFYFTKKGRALVKSTPGGCDFLTWEELGKVLEEAGKSFLGTEAAIYLFSVDDNRYYLYFPELLAETQDPKNPGDWEASSLEACSLFPLVCREIREIRDEMDGVEVYAAFTAYHLWRWYADQRFCGRCGKPLVLDAMERAMRCPDCGNLIFPRINPAVIVGVIHGEELLLTKYRTGYGHNALVAGFTEIGETLEETVTREVMEETGLHVKNIRYYKSQPWGMAQDILVGYYCDVDGDPTIVMDEHELKYADWVKREEIELQPNSLSLTNEMMRMFKEGKICAK
ncbi:MAG: NAD(+) diphosphatase [Lachnospiraceae bacterium]|nr:NAD(+) diphosphatase [Lachnospiraceae bacterium]